MKCPNCNAEINIGSLLGSISSKAKSEAARTNGAKGGRPKKIHLSRIRNDNDGKMVWEWQVGENGGYCATKADALNDAQIVSRG